MNKLSMKKGAIQKIPPLTIEKLVPGGQAIGTLTDGQKIFLWNALPGEVVETIQITKVKSHYLEGIATKHIRTSPERILPKDDCYLSTSPWQNMSYNYELEQKNEILREIFRQHSLNFKNEIAEIQTDGKDFYYRNKMEYALYYDHNDANIKPAFHARGSHRKVPIDGSSIERPEIFTHAKKIIAELNARGEDARKYQSLLLRCDQNGKVSGGLYENYKPHPVFATLNDSILETNYSYSPNGFFQINLPVYELALKEISSAIKTEKVLDLYSGVGTIGLSVALDKELTLVECDKSAYIELENNVVGTSARAIFAKAEEALDFIHPDQTVIVDPPRAGCDSRLIGKLLNILPQQIIYLSCNPATQARDVKMLEENYTIISVTPYNFFPRTPHLENLIILERK